MTKILVTDDNSVYRQTVMEVLRMEGYEVIEAENGAVAVEQIQQHQPDVVLCDLDMPVMNGLDVLVHLKADERTAHIPFVLVTGNTDETLMERALSAGAATFIRKPMNLSELFRLLSQLTG